MKADTVIATHVNTDFDGFASMLAARRLYPESVATIGGSLNRNVREFYRLHADELDVVEVSRLELDAVKRLVVVETSDRSRLGELEVLALDSKIEKVLFDHHGGEPPSWVRAENAVLSEDAALTTTLVGVLAERELSVTPLEATVFALGIHEDTGSLTFPGAGQRDAEALAWCLRHGASQELIAEFLSRPLGDDERELLSALIKAAEPIEAKGNVLLIAAVSWRELDVGISNLATKLLDLTDARALVVLVEMDDRVFCVTRSRAPEIDASALAAALGGGGHAEAGSAAFKGSLSEARAHVADSLEEAVSEPLRARDVMSSPVRCVGPEESIASAMVVCQRHGQSGVLVAEDGKLVGAVSREDLDKAIGHNLSHAPVKGIMSSKVASSDEDTPLPELQRLLAADAEGRIAVVRGDRIAGVVTRSDVLRALGEEPTERPLVTASLAHELAQLIDLALVFESVAAVSEGLGGVYLVGGTVRDILLGEPNFDVDIAVEGDAIAFAQALADVLGGRVRAHDKFGTAVVIYDDARRVDVVTARTEFYDAPAALPHVEHASIREDLFRRDFTINAMAASLKGGDFGRLVDPFGGRRDLAARTLRVLHNLSFIDDPTRIFRAIRYENRYGFRMDDHTQRLARGCIEMGLVGDLSSARLRDELIALLEEGELDHSILRLRELGVDSAIHPHLAADEEAVALLRRLAELKSQYEVDAPDWRLGLSVLARRMTAGEVYAWLSRLRVRRRDGELVAAAVTVAPRLVERLKKDDASPAEVVGLADPYAPDAPLLALATKDLEPLHAYFRSLRDVRLEVTGADLAELGLAESPRVGEVLAELRRRKLNGLLDGRDSELAAAKELIAQA